MCHRVTNPSCSALLPEKLRDLIKKNVFETMFPLHEVRPSTQMPGRKSHKRWRSQTGWERALGNGGCIGTHLDVGHNRAPDGSWAGD